MEKTPCREDKVLGFGSRSAADWDLEDPQDICVQIMHSQSSWPEAGPLLGPYWTWAHVERMF